MCAAPVAAPFTRLEKAYMFARDKAMKAFIDDWLGAGGVTFGAVAARFCACGTAIARLARRRTVAVPAFRAALMWNMETS